MPNLISPLDSLSFTDFVNHKLLRSYLGEYKVEIVWEYWDGGRWYTMSWPHGFMGIGYVDMKRAERYAFCFVWNWLRSVSAQDADELANKYMSADAQRK